MIIRDAKYVGSFVKMSDCPPEQYPEYVFIGRSNVGKSSLINMLCNRKGLAKISVRPGKTQTINFYEIDQEWYLVDMPGYGYASVSQTQRASWEKMTKSFLTKRQSLVLAFVLVDGNIPPQKIDLQFINQLAEWELPFCVVFTKTDRPGKMELQRNLAAFNKEIMKSWEELPRQFITSASKATGKEELLAFISELNDQFESSR